MVSLIGWFLLPFFPNQHGGKSSLPLEWNKRSKQEIETMLSKKIRNISYISLPCLFKETLISLFALMIPTSASWDKVCYSVEIFHRHRGKDHLQIQE